MHYNQNDHNPNPNPKRKCKAPKVLVSTSPQSCYDEEYERYLEMQMYLQDDNAFYCY